jgi:hypothetical protein
MDLARKLGCELQMAEGKITLAKQLPAFGHPAGGSFLVVRDDLVKLVLADPLCALAKQILAVCAEAIRSCSQHGCQLAPSRHPSHQPISQSA